LALTDKTPGRHLLPGSWRTTTVRIGLIVFAALMVTSALLLVFVARLTHDQLYREARTGIAALRNDVADDIARDGITQAAHVIDEEVRLPGSYIILLADPGGAHIAGNLARWPAGLGTAQDFAQLVLEPEGEARVELYGVATRALPGGHRLLVARSLVAEERLRQSLMTSLFASIALALVLALLTSLLLARLISARIQNIADVAAAVAAGDLGRRVDEPVAGGGDAFDAMARALNTMLARIEALLGEIRMVTDGLAHDLRSPLTRMKARIDRLARSETDNSDNIAAIGAEADTLLSMLENSLELSRIEAGIGREAFDSLDVAALARDLAEMYQPLAEESGVTLNIAAAGPLTVIGHRNLLGRALANLIDNALRYGAAGGRIDVTAEADATGVVLSVGDHGTGIAAGDHGEALRRFGRVDAARGAGGVGLGLSLAAAIARLHGGTLALHDNRPGLRVVIDLPQTSGAA